LLSAGCASRRPRAPLASRVESFAPVLVSPDRVIRTVAGLRPFRPSGFVVRREKLGAKTVIHNYGHGGGGITLSWGTAHLAVELARPLRPERAAVLGCGAVGLATARLLQRAGAAVTIYARELPPETTSFIAGGQWWPTSVFERSAASDEFRQQFVRAARLSHHHFQTLPAERFGIRWIRNYLVTPNPPPGDDFILGPGCPFNDLYPEFADLPEHATPFGRFARRFTTMLIEPPIYLPAMMQDFQLSGGRLVVRELGPADLEALAEPVIFNCTGLGSGKLFGDTEITPVKGQLTFLLPQPEINYNLMARGLYMFPRRDGILLGGTWERGNWDPAPDPEAARRILAGHQELFSGLRVQ
jgi:glycine/D-amino acid oxidase-like deaminating enzyme